MSKSQEEFQKDREILITLIKEDKGAIPSREGGTVLTERADEISKLNVLNDDKIYEEELASSLNSIIPDLDRDQFSSLLKYINRASFVGEKIIESYLTFVKGYIESGDSDYSFKKLSILYLIVRMDNSYVPLSFLEHDPLMLKIKDEQFHDWIAIISEVSWQEAAKEILIYLKNSKFDYDFSIIENHKDRWLQKYGGIKLESEVRKWAEYLKEEDKEYLKAFSEEYGVDLNIDNENDSKDLPYSDIPVPKMNALNIERMMRDN